MSKFLERHPFLEKIEHYNSKLIPPALILLLVVIVFELFVHIENQIIEILIEIADYLVIAIFVIDLIFLAIKAKNTKFFFKNYWLDILAVFPFILFARFVTFMAMESVSVGQAIVHESLEVSKVATKVEGFAKVEELAKGEKFTKAGKYLKFGARLVRIVSKSTIRFKRKKLKRVRA